MVKIGVGVMIALFFYWKSARLTQDIEDKQNEIIIQKKKYTLKNLFSLTMRISLDVSSIKEQLEKNNSAMRNNINLHVTTAEGSISAFETIFGGNFSYLDIELEKVTSDFNHFISNLHQLKVNLNNLRHNPDHMTIDNLQSLLIITQHFLLLIVSNIPEVETEFREIFPQAIEKLNQLQKIKN